MNPAALTVIAVLLFGQTSGEQFFEDVTPGLSGIFASVNSSYLSHKEFSISLSSVLSPYEVFPYNNRAESPAFFGEFGIGLFDKLNVLLKAGIYPKNETEKRATLLGAGLRLNILKNEEKEHLSFLLSYNQLRDLKFHPQDPNFTAQYSRLSHINGRIELNKKLLGIFFGLGLGYQYNLIDGKYWQEAAGLEVTDFDENMGYFLGNVNVEKRFSWIGFDLGVSMSKNIPAFNARLSFYK